MKLAHTALILIASALVSAPACFALDNWQSLDQQGQAMYKIKNYPEAEALLKQAVQVATQNNDQAGQDKTLFDLGWVYNDQKNYPAAEQVYIKLVQLRQKMYGPTSMKTEAAYRLLGNVELAEGKTADALTNLMLALKIVEAQPQTDANNKELMGVLRNVADVYKAEGNTAQYQAYMARAQKLAFAYMQQVHFGK